MTPDRPPVPVASEHVPARAITLTVNRPLRS